jgi:ankyrin repeat protein
MLMDTATFSNIVDARGWNRLHYAAALGDSQLLYTLLSADATDLQREDSNGDTALHCAAMSGTINTVKALLAHGADVNYKNKLLRTPLHIACQGNQYDIICLLVDAGANVNVANCRDETPLHLASGAGNLNAVKLLITHGANPLAETSRGRTSLHYACSHGHTDVAEYLIKSNAALVNLIDHKGNTPLHCAVSTHHTDTVVLLYKNRVNVDAENEHGYTAWDLAASVSMKKLIKRIAEHKTRLSVALAKKSNAFAVKNIEKISA